MTQDDVRPRPKQKETGMPDGLRALALAVGGCMEFGSPGTGPAGVRVIPGGEPGEQLDARLLQVSPADGEPRINLKNLLGLLDRTDRAYVLTREKSVVMMEGV